MFLFWKIEMLYIFHRFPILFDFHKDRQDIKKTFDTNNVNWWVKGNKTDA